MAYADQLYSTAQQMASQGSTPVERQRNAFLADIWLMEAVDALGGKNYDPEIGLAQRRLAEWEAAIANTLQQGTVTFTTVRNAGAGAPTSTLTLNSEADINDALIANINEQIGGTSPSPLGFSLLADAYRGGRRSDVSAEVNDAVESLLADYQNASENLANITDFTNVPPEEQAAILASDTYKSALAEVQRYEQQFGEFTEVGLSMPVPTLTKDANGNYSSLATQTAQNVGRAGEPLRGVQQPDGTWNVVGANSGTVYETFPDASQANAYMTAIQSGSLPDPTGAYDFAGTPAEPYVNMAALNTYLAPGGAASATGSTTGAASSGSIDEYLSGLSASVDAQAAAAEAQGFTVTPEMRAAYLEQARTELDPYFGEVIRLTELNMGTSLSRLVEDARASEATLQRQYGQSLTNTQENLQDRGLLYGGVRQQTEQTLADTYNEQFAGLGTNFERNLEDTSLAFEEALGSDRASAYGNTLGTTQEVGRVIAGTPEFSLGATTNIYQPVGDLYGDITRDQTYAEESRANELETAERDMFSTFV